MSNIDGTAASARRYRILAVVAEGGFGRVYRARLEGSNGFTKEVAIKLMRPGTSDDTLVRFREEARILGLLRDRAIVSVEPIAWLDGRPALVMEYADGRSASRLLHEVGAFPATAALEVIEEVARTLDVVYQQPGPGGAPLRLIHRDLKPGNLQIAPSGVVRILDFGNASVTPSRQADLDGVVVGTAAYIAPERFVGIEGPAADIYSLGVLLRTLVTGQPPDATGRVMLQDNPALLTHAMAEVLRIADLLAAPIPEHRPGARRVEELCRDLRKTLDGPTLRHWAMLNVFASAGAVEDPLVGRVLIDGERRPRPFATSLLVVAATVAALVATTFTAASWLSTSHMDSPVLAGLTNGPHRVSVSSNPPGATVSIDGVEVGKTPLDSDLPAGSHTIQLTAEGASIERQITVDAYGPSRYLWDGDEAWRALP